MLDWSYAIHLVCSVMNPVENQSGGVRFVMINDAGRLAHARPRGLPSRECANNAALKPERSGFRITSSRELRRFGRSPRHGNRHGRTAFLWPRHGRRRPPEAACFVL